MRAKKPKEAAASVDLSEYAEERIPFEDVIRKIGNAKLEPPKPKTKARKRK